MAEKEYIEREVLIRHLERERFTIQDGTSVADAIKIQGNVVRRCVEICPAADVVEVVRCKDCKHLKVINDGKVYAKCQMTDFEFLPFGTDTRQHYCGYGERGTK